MSLFEHIQQCTANEPMRILRFAEGVLRQTDIQQDARDWMECKVLHQRAIIQTGKDLVHNCAHCVSACKRCNKCVLPADCRGMYPSTTHAAIRMEICACP